MVKTKTITIDLQAHRILTNVRKILKEDGRGFTLSLAIIDLAKADLNLCDTCCHEFATCDTRTVYFGNWCGNDNVYDCTRYIHRGDNE